VADFQQGQGKTYNANDLVASNKAQTAALNDPTVAPISTAMKHLAMYEQLAKAQDNGRIPILNQLANETGLQLGSDSTTNMKGLQTLIAGEVAKGLGTNDVTTRDKIAGALNTSFSGGQLNGYLVTQAKALAESVQSKREAVQNVPYVTKDSPAVKHLTISGTGRDLLRDHGFDPDNPDKGQIYSGAKGGFGKPTTPQIEADFLKRAGGNKDDANRMLSEYGYRNGSQGYQPGSVSPKILKGVGQGQGITSGAGTVKSPKGKEYPLQ
jgi:hypothetical protein